MNYENLQKAQRLAKTKGIKGWIALFSLLAIMCIDQFILQIPFANIVFPVLIICAASMDCVKNITLIAIYAVLFELSCIAWIPADLIHVPLWLSEVFIGYCMPFAVYKICNFKHKNIGIFSYAAMAAAAELLYFWISIFATVLIWKIPPVDYILSDLPYQILGCIATFFCALPVAALYKYIAGEPLFNPQRILRKKLYSLYKE